MSLLERQQGCAGEEIEGLGRGILAGGGLGPGPWPLVGPPSRPCVWGFRHCQRLLKVGKGLEKQIWCSCDSPCITVTVSAHLCSTSAHCHPPWGCGLDSTWWGLPQASSSVVMIDQIGGWATGYKVPPTPEQPEQEGWVSSFCLPFHL